MREDIAGPWGASSRPMWETLEGMVREKAQEFIQQIMEEEVTELLATVCEGYLKLWQAEGWELGPGYAGFVEDHSRVLRCSRSRRSSSLRMQAVRATSAGLPRAR